MLSAHQRASQILSELGLAPDAKMSSEGDSKVTKLDAKAATGSSGVGNDTDDGKENTPSEAIAATQSAANTKISDSKTGGTDDEASARAASLKVLVVGCGNSQMTERLYQDGLSDILSIDYSEVVVSQMQLHYQKSHPTLRFATMDARALKVDPASFDVIIDKGTLDAVLCGERPARQGGKMLLSAFKALKPGGVFFVISYGPPQSRLNYFANRRFKWTAKSSKIGDTTRYIYTLRKQSA